MIKNFSIITATSYVSMLLLGISSSLIGAAARNIGLTPFEIGLMIAFQNIGFMGSVIIAGAFADSYEKPRILLMGSLILAPALLTFYLTPALAVNLFLMFLIGAGIGTYEGVTDAMLLEIHPQRAGLHININHFFVTVGSILITLYLIFLQMDWRNAVIQTGILVLFLAVCFFLTKLSNRKVQIEPYLKRIRLLAREKLIIVFFIATCMVVGVEAGTVGILTTYLMDLRGFTQVTSKVGLIVFLVGIAVGRILLGVFTPKASISKFILLLFGSSVVVYSSLYFIDLGTFTYGLVFLGGLAISALLPLMLTYAGYIYKDMAGTALGTIKVAIPVGGILIPLLMSLMVNYTTLRTALWIFPIAFLFSFILLFQTFKGESTQNSDRSGLKVNST
jgi:fucose permease